MIINLPKKRINTMTNVSKSFTHKMAAKTSWHRCGTKLCHFHPEYVSVTLCEYELSDENVFL